jgi:hypothetical protein
VSLSRSFSGSPIFLSQNFLRCNKGPPEVAVRPEIFRHWQTRDLELYISGIERAQPTVTVKAIDKRVLRFD